MKNRILSETQNDEHAGNPHLRSFKQVSGYTIHATDGKLGEVENFLINTTTWDVPFLIVETGSWFSGRKILTVANHIKTIEWESSRVYVDQTKDFYKNSPEFDYDQLKNQEFEHNWYNYYQIRQ